jgi:hypothetical protein
MEKNMKSKLLAALLVTVCGLSVAVIPGFAHHGTGNSYDSSKWAAVTGTVTEFEWKNPHSGLYMDVKGDNGQMIHYSIEMNSPGVLERQGWTRRTIKVGDTVTATVHPSLAGAPIGLCYDCKVVINGKDSPNANPDRTRGSN